jgi:hypothetical protein
MWAIMAVAVMAIARFVAAAIGAVGDDVRDLVRPRR